MYAIATGPDAQGEPSHWSKHGRPRPLEEDSAPLTRLMRRQDARGRGRGGVRCRGAAAALGHAGVGGGGREGSENFHFSLFRSFTISFSELLTLCII